MKIPICLLIILSAAPLFGQTGSPGSTGSTSAGGNTSGSQRSAGFQQGTSSGNTTGTAITPGTATGQSPSGTVSGEIPASGAPSIGVTSPSSVTGTTGLQPAAPIVPPISATPGGTITNLLPQNIRQDQVVDPAGANAVQGVQGVPGTPTTGSPVTQASGRLLTTDEGSFGNQFRQSIGQNGATQLSFPDQNAVVTIVSTDGSLVLQGAVTTQQQKQDIEDAISGIAAGTFIDNQIQVNSNLGSSPSNTSGTPSP